jgi:hypothetical protein
LRPLGASHLRGYCRLMYGATGDADVKLLLLLPLPGYCRVEARRYSSALVGRKISEEMPLRAM